jgi:hypothetical protein
VSWRAIPPGQVISRRRASHLPGNLIPRSGSLARTRRVLGPYPAGLSRIALFAWGWGPHAATGQGSGGEDAETTAGLTDRQVKGPQPAHQVDLRAARTTRPTGVVGPSLRGVMPLPRVGGRCDTEFMSPLFSRSYATRMGAPPGSAWRSHAQDLVDWRTSLRRADRACCCPARPTVVVIMPPAPGRPPVDLLLCRHRYRVHGQALAAVGAVALDRGGRAGQPRNHAPGGGWLLASGFRLAASRA